MNCISNEVIKFIDERLPTSFHKEEGSSNVSWVKDRKAILIYVEYTESFKVEYPQVKGYIGYLSCRVSTSGNYSDYIYIRDDEEYEEQITNLILEVCKND